MKYPWLISKRGPLAMVPRYYCKIFNYYEVYGNFCTWACAKRFATTNQEYFTNTPTSVDYFAWKFFGAILPVPNIPPPFVLGSFSEFGMTIEEYRNIGKVFFKPGES